MVRASRATLAVVLEALKPWVAGHYRYFGRSAREDLTSM